MKQQHQCGINLDDGDTVLIKKDFKVLRTDWRFGKILQDVKGRDGKVLGAKL